MDYGMNDGMFVYSGQHHFLASFVPFHSVRPQVLEDRLLSMYRTCPLKLIKYPRDLDPKTSRRMYECHPIQGSLLLLWKNVLRHFLKIP